MQMRAARAASPILLERMLSQFLNLSAEGLSLIRLLAAMPPKRTVSNQTLLSTLTHCHPPYAMHKASLHPIQPGYLL